MIFMVFNINSEELTYNSTYNNSFNENKQRREEFKNAITAVKNFLKEYVLEHGIGELKPMDEDNVSFKIKVPHSLPIKDLVKFSDELYEKVLEFVEMKNIKFILDKLSIMLSR